MIHLFTADLCIIFIILNSVILYNIPLHHSLTHLTVGVAASFIFRQFDPLWGEQRSNRSQASWPRVSTMGRLDQWYRAENALHIHVVIIRIICFTLWCDRIVTEFLMTGHFKSRHKARLNLVWEAERRIVWEGGLIMYYFIIHPNYDTMSGYTQENIIMVPLNAQ